MIIIQFANNYHIYALRKISYFLIFQRQWMEGYDEDHKSNQEYKNMLYFASQKSLMLEVMIKMDQTCYPLLYDGFEKNSPLNGVNLIH